MAFEEDIDDILRELLRETSIIGAAIDRSGNDPFAGETQRGELRRVPLGRGTDLVVLAEPEAAAAIGALLERASREIRACVRMWERDPPHVVLFGRVPRTRKALVDRIARYLEAFVASHNALGAVVLRGPNVVAVGAHVDEAHLERLAFIRKRIDAEAEKLRGKSSHSEVDGEDHFGCSFWFDAYLVMFFSAPWSLDFVRHRARLVCRELCAILPHLDDPPESPAKINPLPE